MSTETMAAETATERTDGERYEDLARSLRTLSDVSSVVVDEDRLPVRVRANLAVANIPEAVRDHLDEFDVTIRDAEVLASGHLALDLVTPERFKPAGVRETREYGPSSVALTFTREALELSGIDEDTEVALHARDGAILLTTH